MIKKQKRFVFVIPFDLYTRVKSYARANDITIAEAVRRAVESFLRLHKY